MQLSLILLPAIGFVQLVYELENEETLLLLERQLDLLDMFETVLIQKEHFSEGLGDTATGQEESKDP